MATSPYDNELIGALAHIAAFDAAPLETMGAEAWNYLQAYWRDIARDGWAKTWWNLPFNHPAIGRALRIDRTQVGATYALAPFRYFKDESGRHLILAAHPCPQVFVPADLDWLGIETIVAWEPTTGKVEVLTDDRPQLFGRLTEDDNTVFDDPRAFFTAWMKARAWYSSARQQAASAKWSATPPERDVLPGALIIGDAEAVHWPTVTMPRHIQCVGIDPKRVNRAILKSASLPMCTGFDTARAA